MARAPCSQIKSTKARKNKFRGSTWRKYCLVNRMLNGRFSAKGLILGKAGGCGHWGQHGIGIIQTYKFMEFTKIVLIRFDFVNLSWVSQKRWNLKRRKGL